MTLRIDNLVFDLTSPPITLRGVELRSLSAEVGRCSYVGECSGDAIYRVRYDISRDGGGPTYLACTAAAKWIERVIREDGAANIRTLTRIEEDADGNGE